MVELSMNEGIIYLANRKFCKEDIAQILDIDMAKVKEVLV